MFRVRAVHAVLLAASISACTSEPFEGLLPSPADEGGPRVVFDLLAKPLPEIPFPTDLATRLDVDSPTGRRINASITAPTLLEQDVRSELDMLDGWGTFAPISVQFDHDLDVKAIRAAHANAGFADDVVYLVNLTTGAPVALDLGRGAYPATLQDSNGYFDNDPRGAGASLFFETYDEDANRNGLLDPGEDTDGDGTLDHPNTLDPKQPQVGLWNPAERAPAGARGNHAYRDLLTFYERQTHTLLLRPMVPLAERTPYAVVLTRRLVDEAGRPVQSPFAWVSHVAQASTLAPLLEHVDAGKIEGLKRTDIAFSWMFTTQSVTTDLLAIREGLYGRGKLAALSTLAPDRLEDVLFTPNSFEPAQPLPLHPLVGDANGLAPGNPFILPASKLEPIFRNIAPVIAPDWGTDVDLLLESFKFVDYIVFGSFKSPDFLDDPAKPSPDAVFRLNAEQGTMQVWQRPPDWKTTEANLLEGATRLAANSKELQDLRDKAKRAVRDRVTFMLFVPKQRPADKIVAPFPVAIYGHGYGSASFEALGFAGNLAKYGVASVCVNAYGHGLPLDAFFTEAIRGLLQANGIGPLTDAAFDGRARDLDHDGTDDSGGDFWVSNSFHTRDVVRQSVIDWLQLVRVFRSFGTYDMGDLNGDGKSELAGDFNADGVVDVSGPAVDATGRPREASDFFVWGLSLGGIISSIAAAVEPAVVAAAPFSGAAGLTDVGTRSNLGRLQSAIFLEVFGPLLVGEPAPEGGAHLVWDIANIAFEGHVRLTADPIDLKPGDRVVLDNLNPDGEGRRHDEAIVGPDLRFRLVVPADGPSFYDDSPVDAAPVYVGGCEPEALRKSEAARLHLRRHADCVMFRVLRNGREIKRITTFPQDVAYQGRTYSRGTPLVALARGLGLRRGSPEFRRLMNISQAIADPADPGNYASMYVLDPPAFRGGRRLPILIGESNGDGWVPSAAGHALGRAAGLIPYDYDEARDGPWGMSPTDVLIRTGATEGVEKLRYYTPVAAHARDPEAAVDADDRDLVDLVECEDPAHCEAPSLVDVTGYGRDDDSGVWLDDGNPGFNGRGGVPRLKVPLRESLSMAFETPDYDGVTVRRRSAVIIPYLEAEGHHGFDIPHPRDPFDVDLWMINLIGRYFQTRGAELHYDTCMHRDGWDRRRDEPGAKRDPRCDFIPEYPATW